MTPITLASLAICAVVGFALGWVLVTNSFSADMTDAYKRGYTLGLKIATHHCEAGERLSPRDQKLIEME